MAHFGTVSGDKNKQYMVHAEVIGGLELTASSAGYRSLPLAASAAASSGGCFTGSLDSTVFASASGSVIQALNKLAFGQASLNTIAEMTDSTISAPGGGHMLVYDGTDSWDNQAMSGDGTLSNAGAFALTATENSTLTSIDSLIEVGTIAGGTWAATDVAVAHGGTGASTAAAARTNLGLVKGIGDGNVLAANDVVADNDWLRINGTEVEGRSDAEIKADLSLEIGTDVQAYDADLAALAGLTSAADKGIQFTGSGAAATYDLTAAGKALLDDANATAQLVTLGLTATAAELNYLDNDNLTAADITKLAALDSTAAELNIVDGGTSATATTLVAADRVVVNDGGTMVQVAMSDFETFMESNLDTLNEVTSASSLVTVGTIGTGVWQGTAIAQAYIAGNAINESKIADDAVGVAQIVALGVGTAEIQAGSITGPKFDAILDHSTNGDYLILDAGQAATGGLMLKGKNAAGTSTTFRVVVDGGILQLVADSTSLTATGATGAAGS